MYEMKWNLVILCYKLLNENITVSGYKVTVFYVFSVVVLFKFYHHHHHMCLGVLSAYVSVNHLLSLVLLRCTSLAEIIVKTEVENDYYHSVLC